jgi:uncharacterized repeat protein (TIGR03803 family)
MKWKVGSSSMMRANINLAVVSALALAAPFVAAPSAGAQTYKVVHTFTGANDGIEPEAGLLLGANGIIYGTTYEGGNSNDTGTVFEIGKKRKETVFIFPGCCGSYPQGGGPETELVQDKAGNLYGATLYGGSGGGPNCGNFGCGTIFKLDTNGNETVLHNFVGTDGSRPRGGLIGDATGNLYGTALYGGDLSRCGGEGCGTVFKLDTAGKLTVLYQFEGGSDGAQPIGNLARDSKGNLYGNTYEGGSSDCVGDGCGVLFKVDPKGHETLLHVFLSAEPYGIFPFGGVILDQAGSLYGTTNAGGTSGNNGTIFKFGPSGVISVLYNFMGGADGSGPFAPLIQDSAGSLYGTTEFGGDPSCKLSPTIGCGTVFKLDTSGRETVLYRFKGRKDGGLPEAGLAMDAAGNLYGTASQGGDFACQEFLGCGVVFKVTPQSAEPLP